MIPLVVGVVIVVLALLAAGIFMARKNKNKSRPAANADIFRSLLNVSPEPAFAPDTPEAEKLRQNLRVKLLYQDDKIDEAVAFEKERNPGGSMTELLRAAVERWSATTGESRGRARD